MPTKILVIDDDLAITDLMSMLLKTHGFEVITTNSGAEGVKLVEEKNPNVVLLDLMMPDMDGWQVSKAIRAFSNVPILSASTTQAWLPVCWTRAPMTSLLSLCRAVYSSRTSGRWSDKLVHLIKQT